MKLQNKNPIVPQKILRRAHFIPREGFQEELLLQLKKANVHSLSHASTNPEEDFLARQRFRNKGVPLAIALITILLIMLACSSSVWATIFTWVQDLPFIAIDNDKYEITPVSLELDDEIPQGLLTYEEAQEIVPFPIILPGNLPNDLIREGFFVSFLEGDETGYKIVQGYISPGSSDGKLMIAQTFGEDKTGILIPEEALEKTKVNQLVMHYAIGAWSQNNSGELVWNDAIDTIMLFWSDDSYSYTITASQLGYSIEEVIYIAKGMIKD